MYHFVINLFHNFCSKQLGCGVVGTPFLCWFHFLRILTLLGCLLCMFDNIPLFVACLPLLPDRELYNVLVTCKDLRTEAEKLLGVRQKEALQYALEHPGFTDSEAEEDI